MYLYIEKDKIIEAFCGDIPKKYENIELLEVDDDAQINYNYPDIKCYDKNWTLKPLSTLVSEGLYILNANEKLVGEVIVPKTDIELYKEGLLPIPEGYMLENDRLVLFETEEEKKNKKLLDEKFSLNKYLNSTDWYIIRKMERSIDIPEEIKQEREKSIIRLNEIEGLL